MNTFDLAISLEEELEAYYLHQAEVFRNVSGLVAVFTLLAKEERKHAELLRKHEGKMEGLTIEQSDVLAEAIDLFKHMKTVASDIKAIPDQLDVYTYAQTKEVESIEAYEKLLKESSGEEDKEVFLYLIEEEKKHHRILGSMIDLVSSPEVWVEDAEFGLRKEY